MIPFWMLLPVIFLFNLLHLMHIKDILRTVEKPSPSTITERGTFMGRVLPKFQSHKCKIHQQGVLHTHLVLEIFFYYSSQQTWNEKVKLVPHLVCSLSVSLTHSHSCLLTCLLSFSLTHFHPFILTLLITLSHPFTCAHSLTLLLLFVGKGFVDYVLVWNWEDGQNIM